MPPNYPYRYYPSMPPYQGVAPYANPYAPPMATPQGFPNMVVGGQECDQTSRQGDGRGRHHRILREYMNPPRQALSSCIVFSTQYTTLNIQPGMM